MGPDLVEESIVEIFEGLAAGDGLAEGFQIFAVEEAPFWSLEG